MEDERVEYYNRAATHRGHIMNYAIVLEKGIDQFISCYLTDNKKKQVEIFHLLLDRLTFESKRTTLEAILKKNNDKDSYTRKYKKLIEEIRKVIGERNYFAHYLLLLDEDHFKSNPNEFGLMEFRNSTKIFWYDDDKVLKLIERINECTKRVRELTDAVQKSN